MEAVLLVLVAVLIFFALIFAIGGGSKAVESVEKRNVKIKENHEERIENIFKENGFSANQIEHINAIKNGVSPTIIGDGINETIIALDENSKKLGLIWTTDIENSEITKMEAELNESYLSKKKAEGKKPTVAELIEIQGNVPRKNYEYMFIDFKDILQSQIIEDGISVTKTSRGSQIGGALVGAMLTGGVGAIIGGLSGKKSTADEVKSLLLEIAINDTKNPLIYVDFFKKDFPISKEKEEYKKVYERIKHWHNVLGIMIKQADDEDKKVVGNVVINNSSIADEIAKLSQLKSEGILTEDEYQKLKEKMLG